jgi:PIN domain nuclease of toxin-antitoxin system
MFKDEMLSDKVRNIVENEEALYISVVSLWEIAIKQSIGKLEFTQSVVDIATECYRQDIRLLDIKPEHCEIVKTLDAIHSDPFDRMIISQAMVGNMAIVSKDAKIAQYPIECIW